MSKETCHTFAYLNKIISNMDTSTNEQFYTICTVIFHCVFPVHLHETSTHIIIYSEEGEPSRVFAVCITATCVEDDLIFLSH
jgi:hypothetical protein